MPLGNTIDVHVLLGQDGRASAVAAQDESCGKGPEVVRVAGAVFPERLDQLDSVVGSVDQFVHGFTGVSQSVCNRK